MLSCNVPILTQLDGTERTEDPLCVVAGGTDCREVAKVGGESKQLA